MPTDYAQLLDTHPEDFQKIVMEFGKRGYQIVTHAIGAAAARMAAPETIGKTKAWMRMVGGKAVYQRRKVGERFRRRSLEPPCGPTCNQPSPSGSSMPRIDGAYRKLQFHNLCLQAVGVLAACWALSLAAMQAAPIERSSSLPANLPCRDEVAAKLDAWQVSGESFQDAPDAGDGLALRFSTSKVGVWVLLEAGPSDAVVLTKATDAAVQRTAFNRTCAASTEVRALPANLPPTNAFTNADVSNLLREQHAGVIYVWSPHMPLSVDGYDQVAAAARDLGLFLTGVLNPEADARYAESAARDRKLPAGALRPLWSSELFFRNAALHSPSIIIYSEGRLLGLAIPGYRDADAYRQIIELQLQQTKHAPPEE